MNKYWRPVSEDEFWYKMDKKKTNDALCMCDMPREIVDTIWIKKRTPFEVYS